METSLPRQLYAKHNKALKSSSPCTSCVQRTFCIHKHLDRDEIDYLTSLYTQKLKIKAGDHIFHNGDNIQSLYIVRVGFIKIEYSLPNGHHQINHFATNGDLIGIDGIDNGKHQLDAIALTDGELCSLNYTHLELLIKENKNLQKSIECAMSRELNNTQSHLYSLGSHTVEQKLAFFLLNLHRKMGAQYANINFIRLPMNRDDLKSYLGVTAESLSRAFTSLEKKKYFKVRNKDIINIDYKSLEILLELP